MGRYDDSDNGHLKAIRQNSAERQGDVAAFGAQLVAQLTPEVQVKFPYNANPNVVTVKHNHASSTDAVADGLFTLTLNGSASNFSSMKTLDVLRYGPGQGALFRFTQRFTTGIVNSEQLGGAGNSDEGLAFGYNGVSFGISRRAFGRVEVRSLTITSAADAGGGDFVITLDGTAVTVTVGANDTISEVVAAITAKESDFHHAGRGWQVNTHNNITVTFTGFIAENASGTFSFADTDSGVTAGTFEQATTTVEGTPPTVDQWVLQEKWNRDTMLGEKGETNPSGRTLLPTNLNVFQIRFQYLGAGAIEYSIEDSVTGRFIVVHVIEFAGSATTTSLRNASLQLGMIIKTNSSYSGGNIVLATGSFGGFIEGLEIDQGIRHSARGSKNTTSTTPVNVLTIYNKGVFKGEQNRVEVFPDQVSILTETVKGVVVDLIINPTQVDGTVAFTDVDSESSVMELDVAGTTIVGGEVARSFVVGGVSAETFVLKDSGLRLRPGDRWVFATTISSGANDLVTVTVDWRERL